MVRASEQTKPPVFESTRWDDSVFKDNLAALHRVDPAGADLLRNLDVRERLVRARGRDGSYTFRLTSTEGNVVWFGQTSMPTVSAPALLKNFAHQGGNIAFFGAGSGWELVFLTQRVEPRQTIFVLESDPLCSAGVLMLHRLSAAIETRQIIFIFGPEGFDDLSRFLVRNPGFDPPERFLQWPWVSTTDIQKLKSGLEDVHRSLAAHRHPQVGELTGRLADYAPTFDSARGVRCLVISRAVNVFSSSALASILADSTDGVYPGDLPWQFSRFDHHQPGHTTTVALLAEMERFKPHFVLALNETRHQLGGLIPEGLPVASWFLDPVTASTRRRDPVVDRDWVFAESPATASRLAAAGIDPSKIHVLPPGASAAGIAQSLNQSATPEPREWDVAVMMDALDVSARAVGIELSGLAEVWKAILAVLESEPERIDLEALPTLIDYALKRAQVKFSDDRVRADLISKLEMGVAETIVVRHCVQTLSEAGFRVRLWGRNWNLYEETRSFHAGPLPVGPDRWFVLGSSRYVLDLGIWERLTATSLDAALAGAVPIVRARPPGKSAAGTAVTGRWPEGGSPRDLNFLTFRRPGRLVKSMRDLDRQPDEPQALVRSIQEIVSKRHTAACRRSTIWRILSHR